MRMSWVSRRITTKAEDIAYCLMGIFDIQMPLLYGEGEDGAFRRLQQEIIKDSDDQSIFAWKMDDTESSQPKTTERRVFSVLARSPAAFEHSHDVVQADSPIFEYLPRYLAGIRAPTIFDNKGLHLSLPIVPVTSETRNDFLAVLACSRVGKEEEERLVIQLRDVSTNGGRYIRIEQHKLPTISKDEILKSATYENISVTRGKHNVPVQPLENTADRAGIMVTREYRFVRQNQISAAAWGAPHLRRKISLSDMFWEEAPHSRTKSPPKSMLNFQRISQAIITSIFGRQESSESSHSDSSRSESSHSGSRRSESRRSESRRSESSRSERSLYV
jgi:hypothetical protein